MFIRSAKKTMKGILQTKQYYNAICVVIMFTIICGTTLTLLSSIVFQLNNCNMHTVLHDYVFFVSLLVALPSAIIPHRCPWAWVLEASSSFWSSSSPVVSVLAAACTRCAASQDVSSPSPRPIYFYFL